MASIDLSSSSAANVLHDGRLGAVAALDRLAGRAGHVQVDVADRGDAHVFELAPAGDVIHASPVDAADGDPERIIGAGGLGVGLVFAGSVGACQARNRGHAGRQRGAIVKELAARKMCAWM